MLLIWVDQKARVKTQQQNLIKQEKSILQEEPTLLSDLLRIKGKRGYTQGSFERMCFILWGERKYGYVSDVPKNSVSHGLSSEDDV